jgi:riboflavin synthase alpha subunit
MTAFCAKRSTGDRVNIEVDQMARYAARLMEAGGTP